MSRRVLMIAYYFPPLGGIGSLRAVRFAEHLPEFGWEPTVVAPRMGTFHEDPELRIDESWVIRSRSIELSRGAKRALRVQDADEGSSRGRVLGAMRSLAHRYVYRPDPQIGWFPGALHAVSDVLRGGGFDAIFSSSVPMTAHLVGRRARRSSGLPWIAEFRDPWSRSDDSARGDQLERSIAESATEVVMTSPTWATQHSVKWGRPVQAIIAGADPVPRGQPADDLVVAHLGSFYPNLQDLSAAWAGLKEARGESDALGRVRLRFIGELPAPLRSEIERHGLLDAVEVTGFVPHGRALELLASSSVLLAAGPKDDDEDLRGVIPAKLLEYLATDLPIIYVCRTPNDGADLLAGHPGCNVIPVDDADAFAEALTGVAGKRFKRDTEALSWRARTSQLASILDRAVGGD